MQKGKCSNLSSQEDKIINDMHQWLYSAGAKYDNLQVVNFWAGYRGVISTKPIQKKERIVFIPHSELITLEMAKESPICLEAIRGNVEFISPKHTYLAIFLLQELSKGQESHWYLYLDILPKDHGSFPINYSNNQLSELIGSPFLMQIHERVMDLKKDYDRVCLHSETFRKYKFREFCWARTMVGSRMFGLFIDGKKTDILAPFADMLNHKLPKQTTWNFIQQEKGFVIESLYEIPAGQEICDSYGRKCNARYLLNYGFVMENNPENLLVLKMEFGGQFRERKLKMMRKEEGVKILKISKNLNDSNFYESMGYLRFNNINDCNQLAVLEKISGIQITNLPYLPCKTPSLTVELEIKTWENLLNLCKEQLNAYPTTLKEDQQLFAKSTLSENIRNILILRMGDKELLQFYIGVCGEVIQVLKLGYLQAFVSISKRSEQPWCRYVLKILSIMPHEKRSEAPKINLSPTAEDEQHGSEEELSDE